jgi:hypothetical protein
LFLLPFQGCLGVTPGLLRGLPRFFSRHTCRLSLVAKFLGRCAPLFCLLPHNLGAATPGFGFGAIFLCAHAAALGLAALLECSVALGVLLLSAGTRPRAGPVLPESELSLASSVLPC